MNTYMDYFENSVYRFTNEKNILEDRHIGICTDVASLRTPPYSVAACDCFQGCPYGDPGFHLDIIIDGQRRIRPREWTWLPNAMLRRGSADDFDVETITAVIPGMRTFVLKVTISDKSGKTSIVPLMAEYRSNPRWEELWDFSGPLFIKGSLDSYKGKDNFLASETETAAMYMSSSLVEMKAFFHAYLWEGEITIPTNGSTTIYFAASMGEKETAFSEAKYAKDNYETLIEKSFAWLKKESDRIYNNLPRLSSSEPLLDNLYNRSLVTYMLCRWENPELCAIPYFSTGSINGACMCSYLWDYCGGLMMHPLYDTYGNKEELKAYLRNDLSKSYALNPVTGGPDGPWYQVNQEKIICMVYYHVLFTGEKEFLFEKVGNKTVLEWVRYHAYVCDDGTEGNALYDYGEDGKAHLELRRDVVYNGIIPDLNARRYMNYMRVYALTKIAGCPDENLPKRAKELKEKLKALWNEKEKWYDFIDADGNRDIRYTVQMFKFLNSGVIDDKEREGLISHLNEKEFLSKFGLHSMSKLDEAYDQDDIDNGGGGICTHFTMQICAQLYETGHDALATDILRRVYWWGTRMPYMGDSCAANMMMNREDTPLQGDISSVSAAQMIFYFIFGIRADFDGNISVSPVKNRPAENMRIDNARLCGKVFSVDIHGEFFTVIVNGKDLNAHIGETIYF